MRHANAAFVAHIAHERDGRGVTAERGSGEREASFGALKGLAHGIAPTESVARVVYLVKNDECAGRVREFPVQARAHGDGCVRDDDAVELTRLAPVSVREVRVETDASTVGRIRPLHFEMLGRRDNRDAVDHATLQKFGCETQGEGGFACAGGCRDKKIAAARLGSGGIEVAGQRLFLPGAQLACGTPGGTLGETRWQVVCGRGRAKHGPGGCGRGLVTHLMES